MQRKQFEQLAKYLEDKAKARITVSYSEVVIDLCLPPLRGDWYSHLLSGAFIKLDRQDAKKGKPFRTSIVVSKNSPFTPNKGYFTSLNKLKNIDISDESKWNEIYISQREALFKLHHCS